MRKIGILSIVMILFCFNIPYVPAQQTVQSTIYVDDDNTSGPWDGLIEHPFRYIQDGINASVDGDTIYVYSGFYQENLYINKKIVLMGQQTNTTIIDGGKAYADVVRIENSILILNFTIQNRSRFYEVYDGMILGCNNISVMNINFIECGMSYDLMYPNDAVSFHNTVTHCYVNSRHLAYLEDRTHEIIDYPCGQIILVNCSNITISHQNISDLRFGIILSHSQNCSLYQNQIMDAGNGILLYFSDNNILSENSLSSNSKGFIYHGSSNNRFLDNTIVSNSYGIYDYVSAFIVGTSVNNIIKNNMVKNNDYGIFLYTSAYILNNEFRDNNWGVSIFWNTPIQNNNFYFNKRDVWIFTSPSTYIDTVIDGNYWGRPRVLPKPNLGVINFGGYAASIPWFFVDWHPAKEPYDIEVDL